MPSPADALRAKALERVVKVFRRWLYMPDPEPLYVTLAGVIANRLDGDAVWMMLVAPPASMKTELLSSLRGLPDVWFISTLSEGALLSGVGKKDRAQGAKGGILREINNFGILVFKDFGSLLSMRQDARKQLMGDLREIYDGAWDRRIGTEGGRVESWRGKVGMLAASTPAIDQHHAVLADMGERFVFYRIAVPDRREQARMALAHRRRSAEARAELTEAVQGFLGGQWHYKEEFYIDPMEAEWIEALADIVTQMRSAVVRDERSKEIESRPHRESPARLSKVLAQLYESLVEIGLEREPAYRTLTNIALSSVPEARLVLVRELYQLNGKSPRKADLSRIAGLPFTTTARHLEDITHLGLAEKCGDEAWALTDALRSRMQEAEVFE